MNICKAACLAVSLAVCASLWGARISVAAEQPDPAQSAGHAAHPAHPAQFGMHPIGWLEFITTDGAKSQSFYNNVFGWTVDRAKEGYWVFMTPKGIMGGFRLDPEEGVPQTVPFVLTVDIDMSIGDATAAGAKVLVPKREVGNDGHIAMITDPSGLVLGLADLMMPVDYSPDPLGGGNDVPLDNTICAFEFYGGDFAKTSEFYATVFGWISDGSAPQYMAFDPGIGTGGVFQNHTPKTKCLAYVWVNDIDAAIQRVKDNGGKMQGDKLEAEGIPAFAYFEDPSGVMVGMMGK